MAFRGKWTAIMQQIFKIWSSSLPSKHTKIIPGSLMTVHICKHTSFSGSKNENQQFAH